MALSFWRPQRCIALAIAAFSFAAGSFATRRLMPIETVRANGNRVFELRIYHDIPGKLPVMESRFREKTSKILAKHNLNVVGYWETNEGSAFENSFVFLLVHDSREEARKNWQAIMADPEFQAVEKAEETEKTLQKADVVLMRSMDFSPMK
ncbi:MAG: hypothetical protein DMG96_05480 [Acidobacteria bacterium]|nr:MAG: hypothetical protein DMG98_14945 [Acidobacteriota bacterium]PYV79044.1 MAG: hypothetical protein DMG96_05480 [Acidobacteriota bacterium]